MCSNSASAQNIARIYNTVLGKTSSSNQSSSRLLDTLPEDVIFDAFFLHAILRRLERQQRNLVLPHHGDQYIRYRDILSACNSMIAGTGQPAYHHACRKCLHVFSLDGVLSTFDNTVFNCALLLLIILVCRIHYCCDHGWGDIRTLLLSCKRLSGTSC